MYYRGANAAIICYDITSESSWKMVESWLDELRRNMTTKLSRLQLEEVGLITSCPPCWRKTRFMSTRPVATGCAVWGCLHVCCRTIRRSHWLHFNSWWRWSHMSRSQCQRRHRYLSLSQYFLIHRRGRSIPVNRAEISWTTRRNRRTKRSADVRSSTIHQRTPRRHPKTKRSGMYLLTHTTLTFS